MITSLTVWQATDGTQFPTEGDAIRYERKQSVLKFLEAKAIVFVSKDAQDLILLTLNYLAQAGSPVKIDYLNSPEPKDAKA
jgi:hypothetical protein